MVAGMQMDFGWVTQTQRARHRPRIRFRRASKGYTADSAIPQDGGAFDYARSQAIFMGRAGLGPLRIAWDTNILSDWVEFGHLMLDAPDELEAVQVETGYLEQLIAFGAVMRLWETRDIRVVLFPRQENDLGRLAASVEHLERRRAQLAEAWAGLACVLPHEPVLKSLDNRTPRPRLGSLPASIDRELVRDAIAAGCHVFLTRDRRLLRKGIEPATHGLALMAPTDLLDELAEADMLGVYGDDWLICDNHKWLHLTALLDGREPRINSPRDPARIGHQSQGS